LGVATVYQKHKILLNIIMMYKIWHLPTAEKWNYPRSSGAYKLQ